MTMRLLLKCLIWFLATILTYNALPTVLKAGEDINTLRRSIVRIHTVAQQPDYLEPWAPGNSHTGWGSGFIIPKHRILTNAHVVSNARFIAIEKEGDARRYEAKVKFIAHDCDLAMLEVVDDAFFQNTTALRTGDVPQLDSTVTVLGYPIGGDRLSVTRGVVSRIDYRGYAHSSVDSHLVIQIDAAINPGNSGGPVIQDNLVVGVAFQGFSGLVAQNVGYMIPMPVVKRFLQDVNDGQYDRYVDLGVQFLPLINSAHRRALGLAPGDYGVMVSKVIQASAAYKRLQTEDVLLAIDGHPIFSDGRVDLANDRVLLNEVVERKFKGDSVHLKILRQGKEMEIEIALNSPWPYLLQARRYDERPRFVVFAGLVFQPLSNPFYSALKNRRINLRYYYSQFIEKELYLENPEVIVISKILPDPINSYLDNFTYSIVDQINDTHIRTLKDVAEAFNQETDFYVIRVKGSHQPLILETKAVKQAHQRILKKYSVKQEAYMQGGIVPPKWVKPKK